MAKDVKIDEEILYDKTKNIAEITTPFNPKDVDIVSQTMVISNIVDRLENGGLQLDPDFQRNPNLWDDVKQSRLIESMLIKIPLPTFYFEQAEGDELIVVDGLQRLTAIKRFMCTNESKPLVLTEMEYLTELNGKTFPELQPDFRRRLREQSIQAYIIRAGTPNNVKVSIFNRINTGGLCLEKAEIRNSIYRGKAANLLKDLSQIEEFKKLVGTRVSTDRMLDREMANRFLAFYMFGIEEYKGNLEEYLIQALEGINNSAEEDIIIECRNSLEKSMMLSDELFGKDAFRKINRNGKKGRFNKPLFETVSVIFAGLSDDEYETLRNNKDLFLKEYKALLVDPVFVESITNGTAKVQTVKIRYSMFNSLIRNVIGNDIVPSD